MLRKHRFCSLVVLRVAIAAIFLVHGYMKWSTFDTASTLFKILAIAEPLGGIAILVGLLTRYAAAGLGIIMIGAMWMKIGNVGIMGFAGQGGWEFDALIFAACIVLITHGPGKMAMDLMTGWEKAEKM